MPDRSALCIALNAITIARREYQQQLDDHLEEKLAAGPSNDEQDEQSLTATVRLLGEATKSLRDAVHCADQRAVRQLERVRAERQPGAAGLT